MAARGVIRQTVKALDLPYSLGDTLARMIPIEPGATIQGTLNSNPDFFKKYDTDETVHRVLNLAMKLEGLPTYTSTHAAGVLITDDRGVTAHVPVWANDGAIVSQYDMTILEELNLLKMDFLGLRTLGVIHEACEMIKKNHGYDVNLDEVYKCLDPKPFQLLKEGKTDGIFQLEGGGMTEFINELQPENMEELIAAISLYRPGPMDSIPKYLSNRRNPDIIQYPFPEVEEVLKETYGVLCYQEQCMRTVIAVAGYDKSDSDGFRKVISKKKRDMLPLHRQWFIDGRQQVDIDEYGKQKDYGHAIPGGLSKGHSKSDLSNFFDIMEDFGKYCFNKSHAAAYAVVGYVTAWLKFYFPVEFMAALMNSIQGSQSKISRYINHCRNSLGIDIVPPDVNVSVERFIATKDGKIIFTLNAKYVSKDILVSINAQREQGPFESLQDFLARNINAVGKKDIIALASIGAFNCIGAVSSQVVAGAEDIAKRVGKVRQDKKKFEMENRSFSVRERLRIDDVLPQIKEYPNRVLWALEKEFLGLYLTGNPIYDYMYYVEQLSNFKLSDMDYEVDSDTGLIIMSTPLRNKKSVRFVGMFSEIKETLTKAKKEKMAITVVEDLTGGAKALIWANSYAAMGKLSTDKVYDFSGYLKIEPDEPPVIIIDYAEPLTIPKIKKLIIREDNNLKLKSLVGRIAENRYYRGSTPVYVECGGIRLLLDNRCWVDLDRFSLDGLNYQIIG
jgi:DNA polymerase-3 subunit alpha